ncbi:hypothetical protein G7B40_020320 [Aetokthonos hydrillicola Thurmond2011]|jgi:hypothetical protein|uniref:Uncharacterized protein n=1 Tax=Aetokthonos hydrillicola Thurmond2011 TaxID=2712845 RepID=A0AAP5IBX6_9CYAN|nr:hypothetical protein [Aetokthonos hydrillicola CCALA 1050]MBW4590351.1 hypothetical protein [Aetokthonos hydrillicola CCALA 1050]MDR9896893.1 hypothetical protein [Aetokthonos hydrillicola Thurmond2011]
MTVAQHITIHSSDKNNHSQRSKLVQLRTVIAKRLWWHAHAYGIVLSILLLIFSSLGFLFLHWFWSRLQPEEIPYPMDRERL